MTHENSRRFKYKAEEFAGQLLLWSFVIAAFIVLLKFFGDTLSPAWFFPLYAILSIPLGFLCVILIVMVLNFFQKLFKKFSKAVK